jgi:aspartokinase
VAIVSAMGKTTDQLIQMAYQVSPTPNRRELDMLLTTGERIRTVTFQRKRSFKDRCREVSGRRAICLSCGQSQPISQTNRIDN